MVFRLCVGVPRAAFSTTTAPLLLGATGRGEAWRGEGGGQGSFNSRGAADTDGVLLMATPHQSRAENRNQCIVRRATRWILCKRSTRGCKIIQLSPRRCLIISERPLPRSNRPPPPAGGGVRGVRGGGAAGGRYGPLRGPRGRRHRAPGRRTPPRPPPAHGPPGGSRQPPPGGGAGKAAAG